MYIQNRSLPWQHVGPHSYGFSGFGNGPVGSKITIAPQSSFDSRRFCHVHVAIAPRGWSVPFACESWMSQIQTKSHDPMGIGANRRRHKLFPGSTDGNGQGNVRNWAAIGAISTSTSTVPNSASAGNALVLVDGARFVKLMQEPVDSVEHARAQALCDESRPFHHPSYACSSTFPSARCPQSLVATHEIRRFLSPAIVRWRSSAPLFLT